MPIFTVLELTHLSPCKCVLFSVPYIAVFPAFGMFIELLSPNSPYWSAIAVVPHEYSIAYWIIDRLFHSLLSKP